MSDLDTSKSYVRSLLTTTIAFSLGFSTLIMTNILSLNAQNSQSVRVSSDVDKKAQTQIYLSQAQSLFEQGQYDRSMSMVNKAIDLTPNNALAWQLLGNCLKKMGRDREALTAYDQAVKLLSVPDVAIATPLPVNPSQGWTQPNSQSTNETNDIAQLWVERARTLDRLNRFQESVAAYDQALRIRCQEQLLRTNEAFPPVCQSYVVSVPNNASSNNLPVPNSNRDAMIVVPTYPQPQQPTVPSSKPSRVVW